MDADNHLEKIVSHYIAEARKGKLEEAFHGLIEQDSDIVTYLEKAYKEDTSTVIRILLLQAVAQYRCQSSISFLEAALQDSETEIWKESLNGLTLISGVESLSTLTHSLDIMSERDQIRAEWIKEAIEQVRESL